MGQSDQLKPLNGLRFAALLLVFVQHIQGHFGIPQWDFNFGHEATTLFFVLSGFVLAYAYRDGFGEEGSLRKFYFARWSRVWPLHALGLMVAVVLINNQAEFFAAPDWPAKLLGNLLLLHSWVPSESWALSFNSVSWFLSVVFFCYAIFPWLISGDSKRVWLILGVWTAVLVVAIIVLANLLPDTWTTVKSAIVLFHPLVRSVDFLLGVALGMLFVEFRFRPMLPLPDQTRFRTETTQATTGQFVEGTDIGDLKVSRATRVSEIETLDEDDYEMEISSTDTLLEFIVVGLVAGYLVSMFLLRWDMMLAEPSAVGPMLSIWIRSLMTAALSAGTVWVFAGRSGALSKFLGSAPLQYAATVSFAFYMTHILAIRFLLWTGWQTEIPGVGVALLLFLMSAAVAVLAHHLFEKPMRVLLERVEQKCNRVELPNRVALGEAFLAAKDGGRSFLSGLLAPPALVALGLLAFTGVAVYGAHSPKAVTPERQYVGRPLYGKAPIEFREEATLLGLQATRTDEGVRLLMFWNRKSTAKRNRSLHLVDANGKIVGYAAQDLKRFLAQATNVDFKEELIIPNADLNGVDKIGIGFFHPEHKGAPVSRGTRSMNGRRLDIPLSNVFAD